MSSTKISRRKFIAGAGAVAAIAAIGGTSYYYLSKPRIERGVVVGSPSTFSGVFTIFGDMQLEGIKLACEDMNANGGVLGKPVSYTTVDIEADTETAVRRTREMIESGNIDVISMFGSSAQDWAVSEYLKEYPSVFCYQNGGFETAYHVKGNMSRHIWASCMCRNDQYARSGIRLSLDNLGEKHYFLTGDYVWPHEVRNECLKALDKFGGEEIGNQMIPVGTVDFSSFLAKAREEKPEVLSPILAGSDLVNCLKQIRELGLHKEMEIFLPLVWINAAYEAGGAATFEGFYAGIDFYYGAQDMGFPWSDKCRKFNDMFMDRAGIIARDYSAGAYVGTIEVLKAINRAGTTDPDAIRKELEGREFEYHKGPQKNRICDLQSTGNFFIVKGRKPAETKGEWDFLEVLAVAGADDPEKYMMSCEELGY